MPTEETATPSEETVENLSSGKEKVSAAEDVIKYAETHKEDVAPAPVAKPAPPEDFIQAIDSLSGKAILIRKDQITTLSRTFYVESIHTPQPIVLNKVYRASGTFREVVVKIEEDTFEQLRKSTGKKVFYNYVSDFLTNDPARGQLLQRTYQVHYPEWIKMEDVLKQDQEATKYFGISLKGIEKHLFPEFKVEKVKTEPTEPKQKKIVEPEDEIQDEFSNRKPTLAEALAGE
ncbi:hypothetical protein D3C85_679850 [compost metagenome]